ncbi:MAG: AsnC family transcriptional regulator [Candidatus Bathyarchaeota archaeon]|nr:AsnC family transcriptional regulator [Candidatus Bathyarchaeum sp.]
MDEIDQTIIRELTKDARKPFRKIAMKIGVSTQTVIKRYNEMKTNNIIQIATISIDLNKIGYAGTAHLLIKSSTGKDLTKSFEHIKNTPNIVIATKAIGDFEGYAVLVFKNIEDLFTTILQIRKLSDIGYVDVVFSVPGINTFFPKPLNRKYLGKKSPKSE